VEFVHFEVKRRKNLWPKVGQWQLRALRGFSGHRAWVRIIKKWAPGSYCLELVVKLVQLPGQVLSFSDASESIRKNLIPCELNNWFIRLLQNYPQNSIWWFGTGSHECDNGSLVTTRWKWKDAEPVLLGGLNIYFGRNQKSFSFTCDRILN
jgi:hypothetical protein